MGIFSSETKIYVSSSTCPMFDRTKRVDNFEAAMLDHTSTLSMEQSEYLRAHYNNSRLKNFWGLNRWAKKTGFSDSFGRIQATFYGDAKLDNEVITRAVRPLLNLGEVYDFGVYDSNLAFFSEDFYIKHLATLEGKANWVYDNSLLDYEIDYPRDNWIRATFSNGKSIEGPLPSFDAHTRFIEISYLVTYKTVEVIPPDPEDPESKEETITTYDYVYGFYQYKEGTGSRELDSIIRNNGIQQEQSFYPVIPIRNWTAWHEGRNAEHINNALQYLQLYDPKKERTKAYEDLKKNIVEGMKDGNIGDIDHITLVLGVNLDSRNRADQRYLFEFFFNCYTNYALSIGEAPQHFLGGKPLNQRKGFLNGLFRKVTEAIKGGGEDRYYTQFKLSNPNSNLDLTYGWLSADYYESNGIFKPGAKVGDYGVLAGQYVYTYRIREPVYDNEGNLVTHCTEDGCEIEYEWNTYSDTYNLTLFCYQSSVSRFKCLIFADLKLVNNIYKGKTSLTNAFNVVKDSSNNKTVLHDFSGDYDGKYETWKMLTFSYVENPGDSESAFVVPLEENSLRETGIKNGFDISYGCYYLIFNCWVKKKKKWYQSGFFGFVISFVGMGVFGFSPILFTAFAFAHTVFAFVVALELTQKTLSIVFGDRWGTKITDIFLQVVKSIINVIATIAFKIPVFGWLIWGICMTVQFALVTAEYLWKGASLGDALKQGFIYSAISGAATAIGGNLAFAGNATSGALGSVGSTVTVGGVAMSAGQYVAITAGTSFVTSSLGSMANGGSIGEAFKAGLKSGAIAGVGALLNVGANELGFSSSLQGEIKDLSTSQSFGVADVIQAGMDSVVGQLVNINTFANLMQMTLAEQTFHKMANLENDYQEFNNKASAANKVLNSLAESISGTTTAETVCKMQACLGRVLTQFPDAMQSMNSESFLAMGTLSGSDICKTVLSNVDCWCDSQLTMDGYEPSLCHYNTFSYNMTWDSELRTGT